MPEGHVPLRQDQRVSRGPRKDVQDRQRPLVLADAVSGAPSRDDLAEDAVVRHDSSRESNASESWPGARAGGGSHREAPPWTIPPQPSSAFCFPPGPRTGSTTSPAFSRPSCRPRGRTHLVVVGTHGRTGVPRFFLGSVAAGVVSSAPCPVLTVRGA